MSEEHDNSDKVSADGGEPRGPLAGERLAEARIALQIPVAEIAKELHLDEYKVEALERNEFDVIGAPVFAKGHLRKYAQLVQVSEADVMADYYDLARSAGTPAMMSLRPRPRRKMSPGPWIAALVALAIVAAVYWWLGVTQISFERPTPAPAPANSVVTPSQPITDDRDPAGQAAIIIDDTQADESATAESVAAPALPVVEPPAEADDGELRLVLSYSGDCWTEITDANGRRLFFGLGNAGRIVDLSGEPPFNVLFGNADNVGLEVNGSAFLIPAANRRGLTARLTIDGS